MKREDGSVLIPGRSRDAAAWQALIASTLLAPESPGKAPTLAQSLTRLHYLDDAFIPSPEWEELDWLIREVRHHDHKRSEKHRIWKWKPRQNLQRQVEGYLRRGTIKATAILKTLEERYLLMRGRQALQEPDFTAATPPSWAPVEKAAARLESTPGDCWDAAALLAELTPLVDYLLGQTRHLESSTEDVARQQQLLSEFAWHAREPAVFHPGKQCIKREYRSAKANEMAAVALEKLMSLLQQLRQRLVRWDSGWQTPL